VVVGNRPEALASGPIARRCPPAATLENAPAGKPERPLIPRAALSYQGPLRRLANHDRPARLPAKISSGPFGPSILNLR
jgi:hypothetical protein